ncbi:MAG: ATP-binding cassette domain-containing protein [Ignisphaera sp.]|nr:ATP-binding cassette domain-containing protein [Ignisphaera sp.]MDW8085131.1 ATP-binding cassette domain-containing protein [Ignisphaera sp.]
MVRGKTTTINILATVLRPTSGRFVVAGHDVVTEPHIVRRHIGIVFQDPSLDDELTSTRTSTYMVGCMVLARPLLRSA